MTSVFARSLLWPSKALRLDLPWIYGLFLGLIALCFVIGVITQHWILFLGTGLIPFLFGCAAYVIQSARGEAPY